MNRITDNKYKEMNFKQALNNIKAFAFDVDGVLSANCIPMDDNGNPVRMVNIKDGYALQLAAKLGYPIAIITGAKTESIRHRYEALGLKNIYLSSAKKTIQFQDFLEKNGLKAEEVLYMGDDIPDYEVMQLCGIAACPADAAHEIKTIAHYISDRGAGQGCARDVIEQVLRVQGHWMSSSDVYTW